MSKKELCLTMYKSGRTVPEIAKALKCSREYIQVIIAANTFISPIDCEHISKIYLCGGRDTGVEEYARYEIWLCRKCGEFLVTVEKNGQSMRINFTLRTEDTVQAAGQYLRYLNQEKEKPKNE